MAYYKLYGAQPFQRLCELGGSFNGNNFKLPNFYLKTKRLKVCKGLFRTFLDLHYLPGHTVTASCAHKIPKNMEYGKVLNPIV